MFNAVSTLLILAIAVGWSWSIATSRSFMGSAMASADSSSTLSPVTASIADGLTNADAPTAAYLGDAVMQLFIPLRGRSGRLRAVIGPEGARIIRDTLPDGAIVTYSADGAPPASGTAAPSRPGVWEVALKVGNAVKPITDLSVITMLPASENRGGRIGLYYIGKWPRANPRASSRANYSPPSGYIEVTRKNQNTPVSDNFRLKDFLPHDQTNIWPKYLVLDTRLIDKLELVLADLREHGVNTRGVRVMSGFRTPQYNFNVGETGGRAGLSRHMYGDASDIYVDNNGDGGMDDINRDRRLDARDAAYVCAAVDRVDRRHPSLIGGCGVYRATSSHGPFAHIDTRGYRARW